LPLCLNEGLLVSELPMNSRLQGRPILEIVHGV